MPETLPGYDASTAWNKRMKWSEWFEYWGMSSLELSAGFLKANFEPKDPDRNAAWALYVELITRITSQPLGDDEGDEETALQSIYSLFPLTREVLKKEGRYGDSFAKLAIPILNQIVRPFTAKWHRLSKAGCFQDSQRKLEFRADLVRLQAQLDIYINMLADMAGIEKLHAQLTTNP
ncbi:MAG: hypothetical protein VKO39_12665 [Cyanobacteriota bacterium]|nr:hypothetical protein [Cyanobacteriota bacterium]